MMRQLTWLVWVRLGLLGMAAALLGPACSDGEQEQMKGGSNGAGGGGGTQTSGNSGGTSSTSSNSGGSSNTRLGAECEEQSDCPTGLSCLTSNSHALSDGGPAHGFCTFACGTGDGSLLDADAECQKFDPNSLCHPYTDDKAYCLPLCTLGASGPKCQGREDVICDLVVHIPKVPAECTTDDDCDINDACLTDEGQCVSLPAACLPHCNHDLDCPAGRFCDPRSGECVDDEPVKGKPFGESCDVDAEVDECTGVCGSSGGCIEKCVIGAYPVCGSIDEAKATAGCLLGYYRASQYAGDVGACARLCDCNADCPSRLKCVQFISSGSPFDWRGRPGLCKVPNQEELEITECPSGSGGAGGAPGAGGAAGQGGAN